MVRRTFLRSLVSLALAPVLARMGGEQMPSPESQKTGEQWFIESLESRPDIAVVLEDSRWNRDTTFPASFGYACAPVHPEFGFAYQAKRS